MQNGFHLISILSPRSPTLPRLTARVNKVSQECQLFLGIVSSTFHRVRVGISCCTDLNLYPMWRGYRGFFQTTVTSFSHVRYA